MLGVQALIGVGFLAFILFTSNPFERLVAGAARRQRPQPAAAGPGPRLPSADALPRLCRLLGRLSPSPSPRCSKDDRRGLGALGAAVDAGGLVLPDLGIALGSWWAYYVLGWGGFWFWDPVENASLMPWLAGTALLHSAIVVEKRDALKSWTVLLAILAFSLSLLGTFLVRSGVLTSVHAFAVDPARGIFILAFLLLVIGGVAGALRLAGAEAAAGGLFPPISREGALILNNLLLRTLPRPCCSARSTRCSSTLTGDKISVGPPFFNATFVPLLAPLLLALPFGQSLAWKRGDLLGTAQRLLTALALPSSSRSPCASRWGRPGGRAPRRGARRLPDPRLDHRDPDALASGGRRLEPCVGKARAEARFRLAAPGLWIGAGPCGPWPYRDRHRGNGLACRDITMMRVGEARDVGGYTLTLSGLAPRQGPNYRETAADFSIADAGVPLGEVVSTKRIYTVRGTPTTQVGLMTTGFGQIYASLGESEPDGRVGVRLYWKPLVLFIWLGAVVMALGGALSLSDRRLRLGVAARSRIVAVMPSAAPAE